MQVSERQTQLLGDLLERQIESPAGVNYVKFQVDHEDDIEEIERLRSMGFIDQRDQVYTLRMLGLVSIGRSNATASTQLQHCATVFFALRKYFKEDPERKFMVSDLATQIDLPSADTVRALTYLLDTPIWGGHSTDLTRPDSYVVVGVWILRYKDFESLLEVVRHRAAESVAQQNVLVEMMNSLNPSVDQPPSGLERRLLEQESIRNSRKIFVVHGHDEGAREMVSRFLERIRLEPIILHEQANRGMTVAEKLDKYSDVGFAIVLLTADDLGRAAKEEALKPRARQNVVMELGYFVGRLGRDKVCALKRGEVEIPSDYAGVVYTKLDDAGGWRAELGKELQAAGYEVDWERVAGK